MENCIFQSNGAKGIRSFFPEMPTAIVSQVKVIFF
jgi:hypothetical protein